MRNTGKSDLLVFYRFYLIYISLPIALIATFIMLIGILAAGAAGLSFAFQVLLWLTKDVWIQQPEFSTFVEIDAATFATISELAGKWISKVLQFAYNSKLLVSALIMLSFGCIITGINYLNVYLCAKIREFYFLATVIAMTFYYVKVIRIIFF